MQCHEHEQGQMSIEVVNKHKHKPTPNDFYIGRGSPLGNPFTHMDLDSTKAQYKCETRDEAISRHRDYLIEKLESKDKAICMEIDRIVEAAKNGNVNLVCFCKPKSCHGDTIKEIIEHKINLDSLTGLF